MEMMLFNTQKCSLHDGPGIRTVVFFQGCPLRCGWCSNPESQGTPSGGARALGEVVEACLGDAPFYQESGGGVTLSGGEPLAQPDAAEALLCALRGHGIHTAIETSGFAPGDAFARVASRADLLLFDVKHWHERRHLEGTGVPSAPILANLRRALALGIEVLPRIPVIPGYNDAIRDAQRFAALLREYGMARAQLLPFHQFGEGKYAALGRPYPYKDAQALREQDLDAYRQAMIAGGVGAFF